MSSPVIRAASASFSRCDVLRRELLRRFPKSRLNTDGLSLRGRALAEFLQGAQGAVVGLEPVDDALLRACPDLKIIAKYGVGLDNIDQAACRRRGVAVRYTPGVNRLSVAELALGLMLGLCRNFARTAFALKGGRWDKSGGFELSGKTVGIIGVGHVGKELIRLLKPFGCRILVNDIVEQRSYYKKNSLIETPKALLFRQADVVTLHVPLTPRTLRLIDARALKTMKKTAFLVNTARGGIVDQAALKSALKNGTIAGAALDVYAGEPPEDKELLNLPNLIPTPHIGGNSREAVEAMGRSAIGHLRAFFNKK